MFVETGNAEFIANVLKNNRRLTDQEVADIKKELTTDPFNRGYANKTLEQVYELLHSAFQVPSNVPEYIPVHYFENPGALRPFLAIQTDANGLMYLGKLAASSVMVSNDLEQQKIQNVASVILDILTWERVDMTVQAVQDKLNDAVTYGLIPEQLVTIMSAPVKNKDYYKYDKGNPRIQTILGEGACILPTELEDILNGIN